jgi:hypothetical protein
MVAEQRYSSDDKADPNRHSENSRVSFRIAVWLLTIHLTNLRRNSPQTRRGKKLVPNSANGILQLQLWAETMPGIQMYHLPDVAKSPGFVRGDIA